MKNVFRHWQFKLAGIGSFIIAAIISLSLFGVTSAYALTAPSDILTSTNSILQIFCQAVNWLFWFLIILSIIMALVAAYIYVTAAGDAEKVAKATKTLTYVAIAIVVALMAKSFPVLIGSFFGQDLSDACTIGVAHSTFTPL